MSIESEAGRDQVTELPVEWSKGDKAALQSLMPPVYNGLRRNYLRRERPQHTVQTATVAHGVYLRLAKNSPRALRDRKQFFALASGIMRQVLVDPARERHIRKRVAEIREELPPDVAPISPREVDLTALDTALRRLERLNRWQNGIVELPFFAGLSIEETSEVLPMSPSTGTRDWITARAWLQREILHEGEETTLGGGHHV